MKIKELKEKFIETLKDAIFGDSKGNYGLFRGVDGRYYFHLRAENNEIISTSQGYKTKQARDKGIMAVRKIAARAKVKVIYNGSK